jgi:diaminopimelate epimerase
MSTVTKLPFVKMHGAGNDFVFVDQRDLPTGQALTRADVAFVCDRRLGVGADGLIVIGSGRQDVTDFRMTYYNADGGEAEMCGNGARCSVAYAHALGMCAATCRFDTQDAVLSGEVHGPQDITVSLSGWRDLELDVTLPDSPWDLHCACNTGVPHLVIPTDDTENIDIRKWGSTFRHHEIFAPAGTNVNWVRRDPVSGEFQLRTYERGVEDETLACGTGASAAAVVLCHLKQAQSPVALRTRGGDLLRITVEMESGALLLRGPAVRSFAGSIGLNAISS